LAKGAQKIHSFIQYKKFQTVGRGDIIEQTQLLEKYRGGFHIPRFYGCGVP
jgi:hypothetical protein